jgi:hypothetical protein
MGWLEFLWETLFCSIRSLRMAICILPVLLIDYYLHSAFPNAVWPWFISIPLTTGAVAWGVEWERRAGG